MNALLRKEIRLVLPTYLAALLLAAAPAWLVRGIPNVSPNDGPVVLFWFGTVLFALCSFGREFSLNTFGFMQAQPVERARVWRTKAGVLAIGMILLLGAWCWSWSAALGPRLGAEQRAEMVTFSVVAVAVAFAGGLWTTLVFRQMAAAFWFTLLLPGAIAAITVFADGGESALVAALLAYAVAGFWLARRQFQRVQETGWTGGTVVLGGRRAGVTRGRRRLWQPLRALVAKELRLQQLGLLGMAGLFALHLAVVALRSAGARTLPGTLLAALDMFGGIWLVVPLVLAGTSVAEERKLGTLEALYGLPVSRRWQFGLKLIFALVLGGLLSGELLQLAERGSTGLGLATGMSDGRDAGTAWPPWIMVELAFVSLALIGFYASTLARHIVQAMALAVAIAVGIWMTIPLGWTPIRVFGVWLWGSSPGGGSLIYFVGWPALTACFLWLSWRNFRPISAGDHLWRGNLAGLGVSLIGIITLTSLLYNRVWELVAPLDAPHGPARIATTDHLRLSSPDNTTLVALLPDHRLWTDQITYQPSLPFFFRTPSGGLRLYPGRSRSARWSGLGGHRMAAGTNWVAATASFMETVGIQAEGSLWVSKAPRRALPYLPSPNQPNYDLVRVGGETHWLDVAGDSTTSVILLAREGTLWVWGTNGLPNYMSWPGLAAFRPQQVGADADWARMQAAEATLWQEPLYLWKTNGSAWLLHHPSHPGRVGALASDMAVFRLKAMDHLRWKCLGRSFNFQVGVREDGTLWAWQLRPMDRSDTSGERVVQFSQIGQDADWRAVAAQESMLVGLKADGSLWSWEVSEKDGRFVLPRQPPTRLGSQRDWVAISGLSGGTVGLAADGTLWFWYPREPYQQFRGYPVLGIYGPSLLSVSRRPVPIENLLGGRE